MVYKRSRSNRMLSKDDISMGTMYISMDVLGDGSILPFK